ncbi:amylo-alpha-1,6-glucosidase [Amycolatopsis acidiphila]|uniref:Amylo-alpha-1,6-glucosidase n=1 Tax=Amycolatopsis acidiphila TaxID=715473 RepID=A0A558ALH3_9PSEU|nr:amylo-alpha-1,6-glucosidase [Amycolatopsis acidiphila]
MPAPGTVTLIEGATFCLSSLSGDIVPGRAEGLFVADTRIVSGWRLEIDGVPVEPLTTVEDERFRVTFVGRTPPRSGFGDSTMMVLRRRYAGAGMRDDVVLRNLGREPAGVVVTVAVEVDFADLFEVKEGRVRSHIGASVDVLPGFLCYSQSQGADTRRVRISATADPLITPGLLTFHAVVPAHGEWSTCLAVQAAIGDRPVPPRYRCGEPVEHTEPARRLRAWRLASPAASTSDPALARALTTSSEDLGALQIEDPEHPDWRVVAAGAPWFMALFGRDSLLTSWATLPIDQQLALGTLKTLARYQGTKVDPLTEEQPGRILHEVRLGRESDLPVGHGRAYYGTADATPLFVALLGELHRWGLPGNELRELLPAADRALEWIERYGDADGDGFVEYQRATDRGLVNQGWKDSFDGVNDSTGRLAEAPIALAEVQAYVYAAYQARASIAAALGDATTATACEGKAAAVKAAFNERFWLPGQGWFAMALGRDKRPVDALASNMGHCLWCGIVDEDKAASVAKHLLSPPMWSGYGVRTLATTMPLYNPISYHNGSVWPHDSSIVAAGLMRYGYVEEAQRIALGLLDAAEHFGGRLPELFCGFDRTEFRRPVPYPTSCSPQAWAAAAPVSLVRTLLRFQPDLPNGRITLDPAVPERMLPLRVANVPLGEARLAVEVRADGWQVDGLPDGITVAR